MIGRCCVSSHGATYANYGGRGIKVCDRWLNSFEAFVQDMGERPTPKHSIDRINNDGHYEPGNCRWATSKQQANNKRNNRLLTVNGVTKSLQEWSRESGLKLSTLWNRIASGTPAENLLDARVGSFVEFNGERLRLWEWAAKLGVKSQTIGHRIRSGWSLEKALTTPVNMRLSHRKV